MDSRNQDEPEPFSFVFERIVILRAAHKVLTELGHTPDIAELVDTAAWLAGDDIDGAPDGVTTAPRDDESEEREPDGQGA
jgi:hypothetical protein